MIIKIQVEITILKGKSNGIVIAIFLEQVTQFRDRTTLTGPAIGTGGHRIGFTPPGVRSR